MEPGPDMLFIGDPPPMESAVKQRRLKRTADEIAQIQQQSRDLVTARLSALAPVFAELGITEDHIHPQYRTGMILISGLSGEIKETLRSRVHDLGLLGGDDAKTREAAKK